MSPPSAKTAKSKVEDIKKATVKSIKISKSPLNKKKTVGGSEDDNTVINKLKVEYTELNDKVEFSQSTTQARLTELETNSSSAITAEAPEPTVAAEAAPPKEVTSTA